MASRGCRHPQPAANGRDHFRKRKEIAHLKRELSPAIPLVEKIKLAKNTAETGLLIRVSDETGRELISYQPKARVKGEPRRHRTADAARHRQQ